MDCPGPKRSKKVCEIHTFRSSCALEQSHQGFCPQSIDFTVKVLKFGTHYFILFGLNFAIYAVVY